MAKRRVTPTKKEQEGREHFAEDLLGLHLTDREMLSQLVDRFDIRPETARKLIDRAIENLAAPTSQASVEVRRARAEHRLLNLAARNAHDWKCIVKVEEMLMRLQGTEAKHAAVAFNVDVESLTDSQLDRLAAGEDPAVVLAAVH